MQVKEAYRKKKKKNHVTQAFKGTCCKNKVRYNAGKTEALDIVLQLQPGFQDLSKFTFVLHES